MPPGRSLHTESISFRIPIELGNALRLEAERQGTNVSALVGGLVQLMLGQDPTALYAAIRQHGYEYARVMINHARESMPKTYDEALASGLLDNVHPLYKEPGRG